MSKTIETLKLTFLNSENKKASLSFPDAASGLEADKVRKAMAEISEANVFGKGEVDLYKVPQSAQYIKRIVTDVFDDTQAAAAD